MSLGDAETRAQHPASMTHLTCTAEERVRYGVGDGLVRISAGLEDIGDIVAGVKAARAAASRAQG